MPVSRALRLNVRPIKGDRLRHPRNRSLAYCHAGMTGQLSDCKCIGDRLTKRGRWVHRRRECFQRRSLRRQVVFVVKLSEVPAMGNARWTGRSGYALVPNLVALDAAARTSGNKCVCCGLRLWKSDGRQIQLRITSVHSQSYSTHFGAVSRVQRFSRPLHLNVLLVAPNGVSYR